MKTRRSLSGRAASPLAAARGCGAQGTARPTQNALLAAARDAATRAYCPYSGFAVGAALQADDGRIFIGVNVENASYGLTLCAERIALAQAVAAGARSFRALAIVAGARTPATPCGACRQVLAEFCSDRLPVFCAAHTGAAIRRTTLGALLPHAFRLHANRRNCRGVALRSNQ